MSMDGGNCVGLVDRLRALMGYRFPPMGQKVFDFFFRHFPATGKVELFPDICVEMDFTDATQRATYWQGSRFEFPATSKLGAWIQKGAIFFDIGANYGFFSYWMLSHDQSVHVYAFDPLPSNASIIARALKQNALESRLTFTECALGDQSTTMTLKTGDQDSGFSTLGCHPGLHGRTFEVSVLTFDEWLSRTGLQYPSEPFWIAKIDVEGFECHVLRGMRLALQARVFAGLMVEINPYTLGLFGHTAADVFSLLADVGYFPDKDCVVAEIKPDDCFNAFFVPVQKQDGGVL